MNNLIRLIGRRIIALPIMVVGVTFLVFVLMSLSPIDPAYSALGDSATPEQLEAYRVENGLYDPWIVQFGSYLAGMLQGDLGTYGQNGASVAEKVFAALPVTLELTFMGLIIAVIFAFPLGVLAALYRDKWVDQLIRVISVICIAMPSFWLAILLVLVFLGKLPVAGALPSPTEDFAGWAARMFLPAVALAVPVIGQLTRVVRTSMVEELDRDYVRTALGAGIPKTTVIARNVLRNALITPVTVLGLRVGYLMGGAVVIEIIFSLPGMGRVLIDGISFNWVTVVQGATLVVAIAFIIVNIIVDLLYILINPRIRAV
ncbi:ABC-type dipeptide/oligopeptide/nickel transport system, permease component [Corynebacterium camporealensis]|uniref:ABC-type dipeptide/oligopeptide/nickel transport system, permease component n=1 Tax=Corynebacterium camporealensis TaxID=161896 RepID=A0A0F6QUL8_9CORY|nr:ABC transporter permease [Corynebacterium camporealensis]AKE38322.1 ABC-type dipeptide/oligopeptide/nickel transport system, permease component [Corynebacterium camporealensis]AVH87626.1 ABC-type dipeptide/oligopeptide/nickel transport system, permease component [Corynebacterium camporealensis]